MEETVAKENKLRSDLREAAWKFEVVRSWTEEELDKMAPVSVAMYISARVFSVWTKTENMQQKPW